MKTVISHLAIQQRPPKKSRLMALFGLATTAMLTINPMAQAEMRVTSTDINAGEKMSKVHEFAGFGCNGDNLSPQLSWQGAPTGTKSFAVTAYDPDAPTGSGWWHWVLINIPAEEHQLKTGAGAPEKGYLPVGSQSFRTDYGSKSFGGACPPEGDQAHRYQFTVFALDVEKLALPEDGSAALVGYYLNAHALEKATLEALYQR